MAVTAPQRNVSPSLIGGGNIRVSSFIKLSTAADKTSLQCGANELPIGIATDGVQDGSGFVGSDAYAATSGKGCEMFAEGDICLLRAGVGGLTAGDDVISDSNGYGITGSAIYGSNVGAKALNTVLVDELALVQVRIRGSQTPLVTSTATTDTATLTAAQLLTGLITATPTAAAAYTLPTPAAMVAAIAGCKVGTSFTVLVNNTSASGAKTITMTANGSFTVDGTATVADNVARLFRVVINNVTASSEAAVLYGIG